jgi:DNA-binding transcriptional ArsR family regulator
MIVRTSMNSDDRRPIGAQAANSRTSAAKPVLCGSVHCANSRTRPSAPTRSAEITAENRTAETANSPETSPNSPETSPNSPETSPNSPETSPNSPESPLVAAVAAAKWARVADVRAAILALCRARPQTPAELASALRRSPRTMEAHLSALLGAGALELLHPDQPNHPKQAYRARPPDPTP